MEKEFMTRNVTTRQSRHQVVKRKKNEIFLSDSSIPRPPFFPAFNNSIVAGKKGGTRSDRLRI